MKIALIGLGHLGKIHFKCLKETAFDLVGISDPLYTGSYEGTRIYDDPEELIAQSEACIIAASTSAHHALAAQAIAQSKHCFVEKPIAATLPEAESLVAMAADHPSLITQVGFVERYNPAYTFLSEDIADPKFIEVHRLSQFNDRGNDVSVVFDLMIHDLDLLLAMKKCEIKDIKATGVSVFTAGLDICNSRIEFMDGSVANLTASRMSMKVLRKFRIFQNNAYMSMDLGEKEAQVIKISNTPFDGAIETQLGGNTKYMHMKSSGLLKGNAIVDELTDFYNCIVNNRQSSSNFSNALKVNSLAHEIETIALRSLS